MNNGAGEMYASSGDLKSQLCNGKWHTVEGKSLPSCVSDFFFRHLKGHLETRSNQRSFILIGSQILKMYIFVHKW